MIIASLDELYPIMKEYLSMGKEVTFTITGKSMVPTLIHGRDQAVIVKPTGPLKAGDLPLYQRDNGKYILHRVIAVKDGVYTMCGDGQTQKEEGITDSNILGVVIGIIRDGKKISVNSPSYKMYVKWWLTSLPIRRYLLAVIRRTHPEYFKLN